MQQLYLDEYIPPSVGAELRPAIILIHGGAWKPSSFEHKRIANLVTLGTSLARRGYVALSIDYRCEIYPGANRSQTRIEDKEDAVDDARAAVRYIVKNADRLQVDTGRIAVFGSSAGGFTAAGMAYMEPHASSPLGQVAASVSLSGMLVPAEERRGDLDTAGPDSPPYIDFHGTADPLVPYAGAQRTKAWLDARGASNYLVPIPQEKHVPWPRFLHAPFNTTFFGFLERSLRLDELPCPTEVRSLSQRDASVVTSMYV